MNRTLMGEWIVEALKEYGGLATILAVYKHIWMYHRKELEASGDFFYKWQYEVRWAVWQLRKKGIVKSGKDNPRGIWELV